jgi:hypothetical protein
LLLLLLWSLVLVILKLFDGCNENVLQVLQLCVVVPWLAIHEQLKFVKEIIVGLLQQLSIYLLLGCNLGVDIQALHKEVDLFEEHVECLRHQILSR